MTTHEVEVGMTDGTPVAPETIEIIGASLEDTLSILDSPFGIDGFNRWVTEEALSRIDAHE